MVKNLEKLMFKIPPLQAYTFAFYVIAWSVELGLQYKRSIFHSQAGFFKCLDALWWAPVTFRTSCVEWWWRRIPGLCKLMSNSDFFVIYQVKGFITRLKNHAEHDFFHKLVSKSFCKQDGYKMLMLIISFSMLDDFGCILLNFAQQKANVIRFH